MSRIIREWGGRPLTFSPGTEFRYSNTNYVIAGAIVEKLSGVSFFRFLQNRIFQPLGMRSAFDYTTDKLPATDASGYFTYGIGPLRPATREAGAWLFGAGNLAMTAADLAVWDQSLISRSLLSEASYREQQKETLVTGGAGTQVGSRRQPRTGAEAPHRVSPWRRLGFLLGQLRVSGGSRGRGGAREWRVQSGLGPRELHHPRGVRSDIAT